MNPIFTYQMAKYRIDALQREAQSERLAAMSKKATAHPVARHEPFARTTGGLRLILRGLGRLTESVRS